MPITGLMLVEIGRHRGFFSIIVNIFFVISTSCPGVLFDGNKELVVTRGNGCPITHLKVFRAPICKPRRGYPEYIDLVTPTNAGSIERLFGLWKTKPQDRKKSRPNSKSASSVHRLWVLPRLLAWMPRHLLLYSQWLGNYKLCLRRKQLGSWKRTVARFALRRLAGS